MPSGPAERFQLTAADVEAHLGRAHARRAARVAVESDRHVDRAGRTAAHRRSPCGRSGGFTIVDEIYQGLSYDAKPVSALSFGDDVITVNSFSKYFNMTGWRLGWLVVPPALVGAMEKLVAEPVHLRVGARAACGARLLRAGHARDLRSAPPGIQAAPRLHRARAAIRSVSGVPVMPDGAFYVYADCARRRASRGRRQRRPHALDAARRGRRAGAGRGFRRSCAEANTSGCRMRPLIRSWKKRSSGWRRCSSADFARHGRQMQKRHREVPFLHFVSETVVSDQAPNSADATCFGAVSLSASS